VPTTVPAGSPLRRLVLLIWIFITTADAFSTPENNPNMVISLTTNKDANKNVDVNFSITGGADQGKFTLSGNTLTFEATDFEARTDHTYSVETTASRRIGTENEVVTKTITVTVTDLNDVAPTNIQISNTSPCLGCFQA
jgi:hypothetical protein